MQFVYCYDGDEFARSLHAIAEGLVPVDPLITGVVGLDGVADAFATLGAPDAHVKIVVESGAGAEIAAP